MTTAEFIIGHSTDDAAERKKEARKILWALLAALGIHLLIGYSLAVFGGLLYSPFSAIEEDKPVELTFVDLATPPPAKKNSMFIENDESKQTAEPKEKTFESNANSVAASALPASGDAPLPTQDGKSRRGIDFENRDYVAPVEGAQPQPSVAEQATPQPQATVQPTPLTKSEEFAMLTSKPTPLPAPQSSVKPAQKFQRPQTKVRISGNVASLGSTSVNAIATPQGRYAKLAWNLIVMRASNYFDSRGESAAYGAVDVSFVIEPTGRISNVTLERNTSNQVFANIMLQAISDTRLPPFPNELASSLPEGFQFDAGFDYSPDDSVTVHTH